MDNLEDQNQEISPETTDEEGEMKRRLQDAFDASN